ncbi:hypothetical protein GBF38_020153, partial [Nibea albiflora]
LAEPGYIAACTVVAQQQLPLPITIPLRPGLKRWSKSLCETLGLQGNMSRSFPTPSIKAAREAAACLVPRGKASGAAGFCFKSTQEQKDVSS